MNASDFSWYHRIQLPDGSWTCETERFPSPAFIREHLREFDFQGKSVLDIGCRDGEFSIFAERSGARRIVATDVYRSSGLVDFLIPLLKSKITYRQVGIYAPMQETFDFVFCFGVLYHLRFPFLGLKRCLDLLNEGGSLLIETAILAEPEFKDQPLLYCPVRTSPYEPSSCSFFNQKALEETLYSMGAKIKQSVYLGAPQGTPDVDRMFCEVVKCEQPMEGWVVEQWYGGL